MDGLVSVGRGVWSGDGCLCVRVCVCVCLFACACVCLARRASHFSLDSCLAHNSSFCTIQGSTAIFPPMQLPMLLLCLLPAPMIVAGSSLGAVHYSKRRLPIAHGLIRGCLRKRGCENLPRLSLGKCISTLGTGCSVSFRSRASAG